MDIHNMGLKIVETRTEIICAECKRILLACPHCNGVFSERGERIVCVSGLHKGHYCEDGAIALGFKDASNPPHAEANLQQKDGA